ncbi:HAD family hydrolase [soil metagenome]
MEHDTRPAIIFDFDGTIADSFPVALNIFHVLTRTSMVSDSDMKRLRGMTLIQIAKEFRIPLYSVPFLLFRGRAMMRKRMQEVELIRGIEQTIRDLSKTHKLFILSSNSSSNVRALLDRYELAGNFIAIYGSVRLLGKAKKLAKIIRRFKLEQSTTWYVGDEVRDVDAAKQAGINVAAVSWGYNNTEMLMRHQPTVLVGTVDELASCFINNNA